ncbi:hypothetical protein D1007_26209 [Hordeum vulgare]|nr:hypothetical protein D1007_26209 [Hordeum vulgare]
MANYGVAALLIASLLVAVTLTDARITIMQLQRDSVGGGYAAKAVPALTCNQVNAVQAGDTCSSIAESGGLTRTSSWASTPISTASRSSLASGGSA